MPAPACQPRCSGAKQVFSLQDLFQPRLEEPVLSYLLKRRERVVQLLCLTSPLPALSFQPPVPSEEERERSLRVLPGGKSLHFMPAPPWHPGWLPRHSRAPPPPRAGELWARGFPTEEPEQFGKAVTSLWPGENGM